MATFKLYKETSLPAGPYDPNGIYMVATADPNYFEQYIATSDGSAVRRLPTISDINGLITTAVATAGLATSSVVPDLTGRDALTPATGDQAVVIDASADPTVTAGSATYVYDGTSWIKISEAESLDLTLNWADIVGGPTSTPAAIDQAVLDSHTHANKPVLDLLAQDGNGCLTYNGGGAVVETGNIGW